MCTGSDPRILIEEVRHLHRSPAVRHPEAQSLHFAEAYVAEDIVLQTARNLAHEVGLPP